MAAFVLQVLRDRLQSACELPETANKELRRLLAAVLAFRLPELEAADEKPWKNPAIRAWLCELKEAAFDAEDLLDQLSPRTQEAVAEEGKAQPGCLLRHCASFCRSPVPIKVIRRRIEKIAKKQPRDLHLQSIGRRIESAATVSHAGAEESIYGREDDRENLFQVLTSVESAAEISAVAIVGEDGIGKTTLARLLYEDERVVKHFNLRMWITASEIYDKNRLLRLMLDSIDPDYETDLEMNRVIDILEGALAANRFLLVLDDVWNEKVEWEVLHGHLKVGPSGSKIVITTPKEEIASRMRMPFSSYKLKGLSNDDCWLLFCKCACLDRASCGEIEVLEAVGKKIVAKLEGMPLSARMVGSLLQSNVKLDDWKMILDADIWSLGSNGCGVPRALWLSYQHLPLHIKQCFSYFSMFRKDLEIKKDWLIQIWMAQGLIQTSNSTRIEDLGSDYFDYLWRRSFLQNINDKYIIHGLAHELAVAITLDESACFAGGQNMQKNARKNMKVRHLSLLSGNLDMAQLLDSGIFHRIRTLIFYQSIGHYFNYDALFMKLMCIRVLCLSDMGLQELPKSIGNLKKLKFLDLSETSIGVLPDELCSLHNLQILRLSSSSSSLEDLLPENMSNLTNLRHLTGDRYHISRISHIGKLTSLQELEEFTVFTDEGHRIEELKNMTQLRRDLRISQLENVFTEAEAKEAELSNKKLLRKLHLEWSDIWNRIPTDVDHTSIEGLQPQPELNELIIQNHGGTNVPKWLQDGSLSELEVLEILDCRNWDLALLGFLRKLEVLRIDSMRGLRQLGHLGPAGLLYPHLRVLDITNCPGLRGLSHLPPTVEELRLHILGLTTLPMLQHSKISAVSSVSIRYCHSLATLQVGLLQHQAQHQLQALKNLSIVDCYELVHLPDHGFSGLMSLKSLCIKDCPNLVYFPEDGPALPSSLVELRIIKCLKLTNDSFFMALERLQSLSSLVIRCEEEVEADRAFNHPCLTLLPEELLQHWTSLVELEIIDCEWLISLGLQALISLKRLKLKGCTKLEASSSSRHKTPLALEYLEVERGSLGILTAELQQSLVLLHELRISKCRELISFLEEVEQGLHCLASLKRLHIHECPRLRFLPQELVSIPSLEELYITECPIQCLPEKGLPSSLSILVIKDCRYLKKRCKKGGEDWSKIAHVFYVVIDDQQVGEEMLSGTASSDEFDVDAELADW